VPVRRAVRKCFSVEMRPAPSVDDGCTRQLRQDDEEHADDGRVDCGCCRALVRFLARAPYGLEHDRIRNCDLAAQFLLCPNSARQEVTGRYGTSRNETNEIFTETA